MELSEKIKNALTKIDFVKRYEELSSKYSTEKIPGSSRRLIDPTYKIKNPAIRNYDDLEDILRVSFMMYEDLKKALTE